MLKKTLYKHTREFLERNLPENFFLFKKSNKKRIKYFSLKSVFIKLNLSKLKLNKNRERTFSLYEENALSSRFTKDTSTIESYGKFLFNLHTIKSQFEKRQTRNSDFKNKLKEKKKLAILYGNLSNKQIKHALQKAIRQGGNININLLYILEKRLDIILYRALFFPTINTAKQWLNHNKVTVNSRFINVPSYMVGAGDIISVPMSNRKHICNNMIKHFIHYKLIHSVNSDMRTHSIGKTRAFVNAITPHKFNEKVAYPETYRKAPTNNNPHVIRFEKKNNVYSQPKVQRSRNLTVACLTIISNLNITLLETFKFALHKKNLSNLVKNFFYFANYKDNSSLNRISVINSFSYKPFKLQANLKNDTAEFFLIFPVFVKFHATFMCGFWGMYNSVCFTDLSMIAGSAKPQSNLEKLVKHPSQKCTAISAPSFMQSGKKENTVFAFSFCRKYKQKSKVEPLKYHTTHKKNEKITSSKRFTALHDNFTISSKTHDKKTEKLAFNYIFHEITDKYKLNLYKAFLNLKQSDLNHKLMSYNSMFYFKAENLRYVYTYVYSYNFIIKKFLSAKHYFKLKPRTIINTLYFKVLWHQINFKNVFLFKKMVNLLKTRLLLNDIYGCTSSLRKTHKKNMFNTYVYDTYTNIFNIKCKILQTKINYKIRNVVLNIINGIIDIHREKNDNSFTLLNEHLNTEIKFKQNVVKLLAKINSEISKSKYYDFLFFLKIKKTFYDRYEKKMLGYFPSNVHKHTNLPFNHNKDNSRFFGKINIKPLHLEISYRTLTIIYLFPPQKLIFPCTLDVELLVKYNI